LRHVLVTGAAGGIGLAVAEAFAARGDTVTGVDARGPELDAAMARLGGRGLVADLADPGCAEVVERAVALAGPVDVLVNAAGIYPATPLAEMTAAAEMLGELGVRADVATAARDQLHHLAQDRQQL